MSPNKYRIAFFMLPSQFFELLPRVLADKALTLLFRRPKTENFEAGYENIADLSNLEKTFHEGDFQLIYLSTGCIPESSTDWEFTERCANQLVEIQLGRTAPGQVALSEAYLPVPGSPAGPILDALEQQIASVCRRGVRGARHSYPDHYWSEEVRTMALYRALGKEASRAWPVEE
ncbi:hypothetical protein [Haliangium ochraceum]|uniref:Uncharacterized protein n=1 Tax=Haliangium ochraceum (strain DSM 14365 / JCM 11303 / SMP-2) TaxID=502025 RepID=D0LZQ1_HALO1|nr:hypothetical protein [Haliangium ochraceum]ACY18030.1 hypothetical protein Hoch_5547 [Haliangium ochraceum DSM 14365]